VSHTLKVSFRGHPLFIGSRTKKKSMSYNCSKMGTLTEFLPLRAPLRSLFTNFAWPVANNLVTMKNTLVL
jgi:hypothetical protein